MIRPFLLTPSGVYSTTENRTGVRPPRWTQGECRESAAYEEDRSHRFTPATSSDKADASMPGKNVHDQPAWII